MTTLLIILFASIFAPSAALRENPKISLLDFGPNAGDSFGPRGWHNHCSQAQPISKPFHFRSGIYTTLHVCGHGMVTFDGPFNQHDPTPFPINSHSFVAPFWTDAHLHDKYRDELCLKASQTSDNALFDLYMSYFETRVYEYEDTCAMGAFDESQMTADDAETTKEYGKFLTQGMKLDPNLANNVFKRELNSTSREFRYLSDQLRDAVALQDDLDWGYVVTWYATQYVAKKVDLGNTFQLILVSSKSNETFAIFHYVMLSHPAPQHYLRAAAAGYNSGDGAYYLLPLSGTTDVRNIMHTTNILEPGTWVLKLSGNHTSGCAFDKLILAQNSVDLYYEESPLIISGVDCPLDMHNVEFKIYFTGSYYETWVPGIYSDGVVSGKYPFWGGPETVQVNLQSNGYFVGVPTSLTFHASSTQFNTSGVHAFIRVTGPNSEIINVMWEKDKFSEDNIHISKIKVDKDANNTWNREKEFLGIYKNIGYAALSIEETGAFFIVLESLPQNLCEAGAGFSPCDCPNSIMTFECPPNRPAFNRNVVPFSHLAEISFDGASFNTSANQTVFSYTLMAIQSVNKVVLGIEKCPRVESSSLFAAEKLEPVDERDTCVNGLVKEYLAGSLSAGKVLHLTITLPGDFRSKVGNVTVAVGHDKGDIAREMTQGPNCNCDPSNTQASPITVASNAPFLGYGGDFNCGKWASDESEKAKLQETLQTLPWQQVLANSYGCPRQIFEEPNPHAGKTDEQFALMEITQGSNGWVEDPCCVKDPDTYFNLSNICGNQNCDSKKQVKGNFNGWCIISPSMLHFEVERNGGPLVSKYRLSQQCCYNKQGRLIDKFKDGAGWMRKEYSGISNIVRHFTEDMLPYRFCCVGKGLKDADCSEFQTYRPSSVGHVYETKLTRMISGDPHFESLDGVLFTFNGVGIYELLRSSDESKTLAQVSLRQANRGSVISGFAVKDSLGLVELFSVPGDKLYLRVDNQDAQLGLYPEYHYPSVDITANEASTNLAFRFKSGMAIRVIIVSAIINFSFAPAPQFYINCSGLLGVFDRRQDNDFTTRGGISMPLNSTTSQLHYDFGESWKVPDSDWLFKGYSAFILRREVAESVGFVPQFEPAFPTAELEAAARRLCGNDSGCLFDVSAVGSYDFADNSQAINTVKENFKPLNLVYQRNTVENGGTPLVDVKKFTGGSFSVSVTTFVVGSIIAVLVLVTLLAIVCCVCYTMGKYRPPTVTGFEYQEPEFQPRYNPGFMDLDW